MVQFFTSKALAIFIKKNFYILYKRKKYAIMNDMDEILIKIKKRIEKEQTIYEELQKKLHSNPIKNRLNQFMVNKKKLSVLDLLRSK